VVQFHCYKNRFSIAGTRTQKSDVQWGGAVNFGSDPYGNTGALFDVVAGSNGTCSPSHLCTSSDGHDGPTGLGTPNGATAF
jgi:hypothetical protein